jgi:hypothetical protein
MTDLSMHMFKSLAYSQAGILVFLDLFQNLVMLSYYFHGR